MFCRRGLSNEQCLALDILEQHIPLFNSAIFSDLILDAKDLSMENIFPQGSIFFYDGHLKTSNIPREKHWKWNKSRGIASLNDTCNLMNVSFYKLNSKTLRHERSSPNLKVWVFNMINLENSMEFGLFWCQKGYTEPSLDDSLLNDLSFLREFVSTDTALDLGWIKRRGRKKQIKKL